MWTGKILAQFSTWLSVLSRDITFWIRKDVSLPLHAPHEVGILRTRIQNPERVQMQAMSMVWSQGSIAMFQSSWIIICTSIGGNCNAEMELTRVLGRIEAVRNILAPKNILQHGYKDQGLSITSNSVSAEPLYWKVYYCNIYIIMLLIYMHILELVCGTAETLKLNACACMTIIGFVAFVVYNASRLKSLPLWILMCIMWDCLIKCVFDILHRKKPNICKVWRY